MSMADYVSIGDTARALGVSPRHARRLADSGAVTRVARGLVERRSIDRYLMSQRLGRTRAWAEHTAWGAIAMLAGRRTDWLGTTQASRLRRTLREITDTDELLARLRDRAHVHAFDAHRAALPRLRPLIAATDARPLGIGVTTDDSVDGYVDDAHLAELVHTFQLRADSSGQVVLRATRFDFARVSELVDTPLVAALDAATSLDPRTRGVGRRALASTLATYR